MTPVAFIDANVPIYAAGKPHRLKRPCAQILLLVAEHPDAFTTDAEVLQELLHRYLALRLWPQGRDVLQRFQELMEGRVEPVHAADIGRAAETAGQVQDLSARDLLHAAIMQRLGVRRIISADADFDRVPHIERLDPAKWSRWRPALIATNGEQPPTSNE
jgi:predicted nucleic acid-binding protein